MGGARDRQWILGWLEEENPERLQGLWHMADATRRKVVGDAVHLRGLVEISNVCVRQCAYCGLRASNTRLERYRMTDEEILACAGEAVHRGYGTVVLQGGEDDGLHAGRIALLIRRIKAETPLAVTLSLGERSESDLRDWRRAGADRYLLRFETSDRALYARIHPSRPPRPSDRIAILRSLHELGYEIGGGVMVGIPGQSIDSLAEDILTFEALDLDMIGVGPFLPHPDTPLGRSGGDPGIHRQVPNSESMVTRVIALARMVCPEANIPSTTALAVLNPRSGYELGLMRGANVVMPNLTPGRYRNLYTLYPGKASADGSPSLGGAGIGGRITAMGRTMGTGPGARLRRTPSERASADRTSGEQR